MTAPPEKGAVHEYQIDFWASKSKCCGSPGSLVALMFETESEMFDPLRGRRHSKLSGNPGGQSGEGVSAAQKSLVNEVPVVTFVTLVKPTGTLVSLVNFCPHALTVPLLDIARLKKYPAATEAMLVKFGGTVDSP